MIPVWSNEYGNSTDGTNVDAGGTQTCIGVQQACGAALGGCAAWYFGPENADNLTDSSTPPNLTSYGQQVASWINA